MELLLNESWGLRYQFLDCSLNIPPTSIQYIPTFHNLQSMASFQVSPPEVSLPELYQDEIAKVAYQNVIANLQLGEPKKKTVFTCDVCGLEFLSKIVLETHFAGSKHQRKLKAKDLMQNLEKNESGFEKDNISGVIRCTVCDVTVNSPQLLATHIAGNKHRLRKRKREESSGLSKKMCSKSGDSDNPDSGLNSTPSSDESTTKKKEKKERAIVQIEIPDFVTKLEESKGGGKYLCNPCQAHCNSDTQLSQHLTSKKHLDKVNLKKKPNVGEYGKIRPYRNWSRGRNRSHPEIYNELPKPEDYPSITPSYGFPHAFNGLSLRGRGRGFHWRGNSAPYFHPYHDRYNGFNNDSYTYTDPLSQNFVPGGSLVAK